jgi:hypothetical protein
MSKIIASAAIRGAHKIYNMAEQKYREALEKFGPGQEVGFPNTAYYPHYLCYDRDRGFKDRRHEAGPRYL